LAKIAIELERALERRAAGGGPGYAAPRPLAQGDGWSVADVVCTSGPRDRAFEERHSRVSIAIVVAGTFQYRSTAGSELMTPGSLLLGNHGECFECGHEHGMGDRCISFGYEPQYFERLAAGVGADLDFRVPRLPPLRGLSSVVARACARLAGTPSLAWEELGVELAARALHLASGRSPNLKGAPRGAVERVTRAVRAIERHPDRGNTLADLARDAGLSPYHFLRTFQRVTGVTPHQFILRARLGAAALRLAESERILDIALDCGFGDLSNFNHAFRAEFGVSPRAFRSRLHGVQKFK
jgi:AraC family transcriptional regulator